MCWSPLPKHKDGGFKNRLQAELELKFSRRIGVKRDVDAVKEKKSKWDKQQKSRSSEYQQ